MIHQSTEHPPLYNEVNCSELGCLLKSTQKHMDTSSVTEKCNQPTAKPILESNVKTMRQKTRCSIELKGGSYKHYINGSSTLNSLYCKKKKKKVKKI